MRSLALVLAAAAACGGSDATPSGPREPPVLRLVGCEPALPPPLTTEAGGEIGSVGRRDLTAAPGGRGRPRLEGVVTFGMPSTGGMVDAATVRRALVPKLPELRTCYEAELARSQQSRVAMAWRLAVTQDGRVLHAMPVAHATGVEMTACVMRVLKTMSFPARTTGGTVTITQPLAFEAVTPAEEPPAAVDVRAWTPFAIDARPHGAAAPSVARATEAAVRARLGALAACFPARGPTGSLRALLEIDGDGALAVVRAGGLGERAVEACVEQALAGLAVVSPVFDAVEVACDLARGDAQDWRIAPTAAYGVIEASRDRLRYGAQTIVLGALDPEPLLDAKTYLVLADLDTPGAMLALALVWANEGAGAVIAVRDGARPPRYVGMGRVAVTEGADAGAGARATLHLGPRVLAACAGGLTQQAPRTDGVAVAQLLQRLATRCKRVRCAPTLALALDPEVAAGDLVEAVGAARRAGFERVLIGGDTACGARDRDDDDDDEMEDE